MWSDQLPSFRSFDGPFTYTSASGGEGRCYLSVYERRGSLPVVIAYELASNEGPSVTNAAASIATQVWRQLLADAKEGIVFVEAYADPNPRHGASAVRFAEVTFDLNHGPDGDALHSPRWRHKERAEVEALIGGPVGVPTEGSY
jgi:hypothetical protein